MPAANVTVGRVLLIKGRGEGLVLGILTTSYKYLTQEGKSADIDESFRVCLWFDDGRQGAVLDISRPTDYLILPGWGTYAERTEGISVARASVIEASRTRSSYVSL